MDPEQYPDHSSGSPYDFIVNPNQPSRVNRGFGMPGNTNSFLVKLGFIVGGAILVMIVTVVLVNILFGNKTNFGDLITLTQTETELMRVSNMGERASSQEVRNAAITTQYTLTTQRQIWLNYLQKHGKKLNERALSLKKDANTDTQLNSARQTSTFDTVLSQLMRTQLQAYSSSLQDAENNATSSNIKAQLQVDYNQVQLLLKQWPS